jgi:ABC-type glycerol-3-phosphate transport system substrate-binding protein
MPTGGSADYDAATINFYFNESGKYIDPNSWPVKLAQQDINVNFIHDNPQSTDYEGSLTALIAAGNTPDIIDTYDPLTAQLVSEGIIIPVQQYINNQYLSNYIRIERNLAAVLPTLVWPDGNTYVIPAIQNNPLGQQCWIRTDWLNTLGLQVPQTMDDLSNVLIKFANGNPNGDGVPVYGTMANDFWGLGFFFDSFACTLESWFMGADGLPELGMLSPRMTDALKYIKNLVDNNAINKDIMTTQYSDITTKIDAGLVGFGDFWSSNTGTNNDQDQMQAVYPNAIWTNIAPPKGAYDKGYLGTGNSTNIRDEYAISSTCKDVDAALRLLNFMCDDTSTAAGMNYTGAYWQMAFGQQGVNWDVINGVFESGSGASGDSAAAAKFNAQDSNVDTWVGYARRFQSQFDTRWMGTQPDVIAANKLALSMPTGNDISASDPLKALSTGVIDDANVGSFISTWCETNFSAQLLYNAILGKGDIDTLFANFLTAANAAGYQALRQEMVKYIAK